MNYVLEINHLSKVYNKKSKALDDLIMKVPQNSMYGFIGVNGAGKTTTFGIIGGFILKTSGDFKYKGKISILPQDAKFYAGRTLVNQLTYFALLSGVSPKQAEFEALKSLELVGLKDKAKFVPEKISHGMFKRLGIAQALLGNPDILCLDEPISGLDPETAFKTKKLIKMIGQGRTVVISSHNLNEISEMCDYVGIIDQGKMKYEGSIEAITQKANSMKYKVSGNDINLIQVLFQNSLIKKLKIEDKNSFSFEYDNKYTKEEINKMVILKLFENNFNIIEISSGQSLEEGFLNILKNTN